MFTYDRFIQWAAGPVSVAVAYFATKIVHANITHSTALLVATFVLSGAATFLGHFKWMQNLAHWWRESGLTAAAVAHADEPPPEVDPESGAVPDAEH